MPKLQIEDLPNRFNEIPDQTLVSLKRYVENGARPGDFLESVLCNDLTRAARAADANNGRSLVDIALFIHCNLPSHIWGNLHAVQSWIRQQDNQ